MPGPQPAAGYSGKPLSQKMGLKTGHRLYAIAAPSHYAALLGAALGDADFQAAKQPEELDGTANIVHLFVADRIALDRHVQSVLSLVAEGGMLWVSWPKKSSPMFRDLTEDDLRQAILPTGWVDVKVAAVDQNWSGLKFLRRKR